MTPTIFITKMIKIDLDTSSSLVGQKIKNLFDFAISDANNNKVYDQEDIDAVDIKNVPSWQRIAGDIFASEAKVVLFGEDHVFSPRAILLETASLLKKSGKKVVITLEVPNSVSEGTLDEYQRKEIEEYEFRKSFIRSVKASPYRELHDDGLLEDLVDFIVEAEEAGAQIKFIDNERKPNSNYNDEDYNKKRNKCMAGEIEKVLEADQNVKVLALIGGEHARERNAKNEVGVFLRKTFKNHDVLSLLFTPVLQIPSTNPLVRLKDTIVAPMKHKFNSWDHIILFDHKAENKLALR